MPADHPTLSHFSREPIGAVRRVDQSVRHDAYAKPRGLWVSVDGEDDWPAWCSDADFDGLGQFRYRVHLADRERVLWLDNPGAVLAFAERFECDNPYTMVGFRMPAIDWARVAQEHAGIVIAPYQWSLRLNPRSGWYYGWDCASGCIWEPSAIAALELVSQEVQAEMGSAHAE